MLASILSSAAVLALLVSSAVAQTTTWGFCFTSSSLSNSPYGPWSVATYGTLQIGPSYFFNNSGTPAASGGMRNASQVMSASVQRRQLNRDGTVSTATLALATTGLQGSDNLFFTTAPSAHEHTTQHARDCSTSTPDARKLTRVCLHAVRPVLLAQLH